MKWHLDPLASTLGMDWKAMPGAVDPYLIWADLTGFKGTIRPDQPGADMPEAVRLALELEAGASGEIGFGYCETARDAGSIYATCWVPLHNLKAVLGLPELKRAEMSLVGRLPTRVPSQSAFPAEQQLNRPTMAVIDSGCAFAHERFRQRGPAGWKSRIAFFWDQSPDADSAPALTAPWRSVPDMGYGRELQGRDIDLLLARHAKAGRIDEDALYRAAGVDHLLARPLTHGTHVLDLAAGADPDPDPEDKDKPPQPAIIFVQLPDYAVDDTSGGSMVSHVMDALRYILNRTTDTTDVVVTLSYGSMAGPHDGSSLLECAMDAVIAAGHPPTSEDKRYLRIVLPAGNHFEADGHAQFNLTPAQPAGEVVWQIPEDDLTDTFLEVWFPPGSQAQFSVALLPPGATAAVPVGLHQTAVLHSEAAEADAEPIAAVIHRDPVASGLNGAMALVALAPTRSRPGTRSTRSTAPAGLWTLQVTASSPAAGGEAVHVWIERDDQALGSRPGGRQSRFLTGDPPLAANQDSPPHHIVRRELTGNSIAHGRLTTVVAACVGSDGSFEPARYTSSGPSRNPHREWPDAAARSDVSRQQRGVLAAGTRSGLKLRMNGTSVSAPQWARKLMSKLLLRKPKRRPPPIGPGDVDSAPAGLPATRLKRLGKRRLKG